MFQGFKLIYRKQYVHFHQRNAVTFIFAFQSAVANSPSPSPALAASRSHPRQSQLLPSPFRLAVHKHINNHVSVHILLHIHLKKSKYHQPLPLPLPSITAPHNDNAVGWSPWGGLIQLSYSIPSTERVQFCTPPIIVLPIVLDASRTLFMWIQVVLCFLQNHPIVPPSFGGTVGWFFGGFFMWTGGFWISRFRSGGIGLLWYDVVGGGWASFSPFPDRVKSGHEATMAGPGVWNWTINNNMNICRPTIPKLSLSPNSQY